MKNTNFKFVKNKSNHLMELDGAININNYFDDFKIKEIYDYNKKSFNLKGTVDMTNSKVVISK